MYYTYDYYPNQAAFNQVMAWMSAYSFVWLAVAVFAIVCTWRIFTKAGQEGWKCLIPFYGAYVESKIVDYTVYFWFLLFGSLGFSILVGIITGIAASNNSAQGLVTALAVLGLIYAIALLVMSIKYNIKLAKAFGQSGAFAVGLIFLPLIFRAILAFGSAQYQFGAPLSHPGAADVWKCPSCGQYNPTNSQFCPKCGTRMPEKDPVA